VGVTTPTNLLGAVEQALRPKQWTDFSGIETNADGRAEFLKTMKKVKLGVGEDPLTLAWKTRKSSRFDKARLRDPEYLAFLSLAERLQEIMGDEPIMLPCRQISDFIGVGRTTVSAYRDFAKDDGYLTMVAPHSFASHRATKFRFRRPPSMSIS